MTSLEIEWLGSTPVLGNDFLSFTPGHRVTLFASSPCMKLNFSQR